MNNLAANHLFGYVANNYPVFLELQADEIQGTAARRRAERFFVAEARVMLSQPVSLSSLAGNWRASSSLSRASVRIRRVYPHFRTPLRVENFNYGFQYQLARKHHGRSSLC